MVTTQRLHRKARARCEGSHHECVPCYDYQRERDAQQMSCHTRPVGCLSEALVSVRLAYGERVYQLWHPPQEDYTRGAYDLSPGIGTWSPPISPASEMDWWGARHGWVMTRAGRVRCGRRRGGCVWWSMALARIIAGNMGVRRYPSIDLYAP